MRHLLIVEDLDVDEVDRILERADALAQGARPASRPFSCALLFLTSSLRTRVGFAAAVSRAGGHPIDVLEPRWASTMSDTETLIDTIRTLRGFVELIVVRTPGPLTATEVEAAGMVPLINGGAGGGEHPTQALIDLAALRRCGPLAHQRMTIVGDLSARSVRSLAALLEREPPQALHLVGPAVDGEVRPGTLLASRTRRVTSFDSDALAVDVIYLAGLPAVVGSRAFDDATRLAYSLTAERIAALPAHTTILSPLPLVDELDPKARSDSRVRVFEQSDFGLHVRTAVLEHQLRRLPAPG